MAVHIVKKDYWETLRRENIRSIITYEINANNPFTIQCEEENNYCRVTITVPPYSMQDALDDSRYVTCYKDAMLKVAALGYNKFITSIIYSDDDERIKPGKMFHAFNKAYYEVEANNSNIEAYLVLTEAILSNIILPPELREWIGNLHQDNRQDFNRSTTLCEMTFARAIPTEGRRFPEELRERLQNIDNYASPKAVWDDYLGLVETMSLSKAKIKRRLEYCISENTADKIFYDEDSNPQKESLVYMALAAEMSLEWAESLLRSVGYSLDCRVERDLIYIWSIEHRKTPQDLQFYLMKWSA